MTTGDHIQPMLRAPAGQARREDRPAATHRFDLTALALAGWSILGAAIDINAHNHGLVDNTFFTPWHLLLYSGVASSSLFLLIAQYRNVGRGYPLLRALPQGYLTALAGAFLFMLGGVFDIFWHAAFGFEVNLEALLSPAHLWLAASSALFATGPLRSAWCRAEVRRGWGQLFPAIASAMILLFVLLLFTEYANVMYQPDIFGAPLVGDETAGMLYAMDVTLVAAALIPAALVLGTLLLLLRRWLLPFGAVAFLMSGGALVIFYLRLEMNAAYWPVLLAAPIAGLTGDWLLQRGTGSRLRVVDLRLMAALVPFLYHLCYFVILMAIAGGIRWPIHMWLGACVMSGLIGLGMSYLHTPLPLPAGCDGVMEQQAD